jgi:hypothetical protein
MNRPPDRDHARTEAVRAFVQDYLDQRTTDLLRLASWDLWSGPFYAHSPPEPGVGWETWPGFVDAVSEINAGLVKVPRTIHIDCDAMLVLDAEPDGWFEHDPDHPAADSDGDVWYEPDLSAYLRLEWSDTKQLLFGELATHLE